MDKETLSSYGWVIITIIILSLLIIFATPFGNDIVVEMNSIPDRISNAFGFDDVSGDDGADASPHTHSFIGQNTDSQYLKYAATCTSKAVYYYSCTGCGEKSVATFEYGALLPHDFSKESATAQHLKSEANCVSEAEYHISCSKCGANSTNESAVFKHGSVDPTNHTGGTRTEYVFVDASIHKVNVICEGCGVTISSTTEDHNDDGSGNCGDCEGEIGSEHSHSFTEQDTSETYLKSEATCIAAAVYYYRCSGCDQKGSDTFVYGDVDASNHVGSTSTNYVYVDESNHRIVVTCDSCGGLISSTLDNHTDDGNGGCEDCDGQEHEHDFSKKDTSEAFLKTAATCSDKAVYYYICSVCGEKGTNTYEHGSALGHDYTKENTDAEYLKTEATCTTPAVYYYSCSRCGEAGSETFEFGSTESHDYSVKDTSYKYLKTEANCGNSAYYYYSCECGAKGSSTFSYGDVDPNNHADNEAEYIDNGDGTHRWVYTCYCGSTESVAISSQNHRYYDHTPGVCYRCGAICDHSFDSDGNCSNGCGVKCDSHLLTAENTDSKYLKSAATCTDAAVYYHSCASCGTVGATTFTSGSALGHNMSDTPTVETPATCTTDGKSYYACTRPGCNHKEYFDVDATGHSYSDGTCSGCGEVCEHTDLWRSTNIFGHDNLRHWYWNLCATCGETFYPEPETMETHNYDSEGHCTCGHYYSAGICGECHGTIDHETCGETLGHVISTSTYTCIYCGVNYNSIKNDDNYTFQ